MPNEAVLKKGGVTMDLVKCRKCGYEVSSEAISCPQCVRQQLMEVNNQNNKFIRSKLSLYIIILSILVLIFVATNVLSTKAETRQLKEKCGREADGVAKSLVELSMAQHGFDDSFIATISRGQSFVELNRLNESSATAESKKLWEDVSKTSNKVWEKVFVECMETGQKLTQYKR